MSKHSLKHGDKIIFKLSVIEPHSAVLRGDFKIIYILDQNYY